MGIILCFYEIWSIWRLRGYSTMVYTQEKGRELTKSLQRMMDKKKGDSPYNFADFDRKALIQELGKEKLLELLNKMLVIRNLETRAEAAYLQGKIGGFFHAYMGQEAIQTACVDVFGQENWWVASYRCHALAYLTGATEQEILSELFGKADGNACGRGGSMHLYSDRMLGGFGIVGGQVPVAIGAALSIKYLKKKKESALCFLGDGAVAQGTFHESMNIAVLWELPFILVVENNKWGMGTAVNRAIAVEPIAEKYAECYGIEGHSIDGMDILACIDGFKRIHKSSLKNRKPIIVEVITERFRGHSVSDPGLYRTKEALKEALAKDPILRLKHDLIEEGFLSEDQFKQMDKEIREQIIEIVNKADAAPSPDPIVLEEGVYKEEE